MCCIISSIYALQTQNLKWNFKVHLSMQHIQIIFSFLFSFTILSIVYVKHELNRHTKNKVYYEMRDQK